MDFLQILRTLLRNHVEFIVVGGVGAVDDALWPSGYLLGSIGRGHTYEILSPQSIDIESGAGRLEAKKRRL